MSEKISRIGIVALLCLLVFLAGCSGGGSKGPLLDGINSPEAAVAEIFAGWRASQATVFAVRAEGVVTAQTSEGETRYIRFRDLSGNSWELTFSGVDYLSADLARVKTYYYYSGRPDYGGLRIAFVMVRESGQWFLSNIEIIDVPAVVVEVAGIKGVLKDEITNLPIQGAVVEAFNQTSNESFGSVVTDASGYYEISPLPAATYYLVINREGYEPRIIRDVVVN